MTKYSDEKNVQILIALLKAHGINNVVASPGGTNVAVVGSLQNDEWFNVVSAVDERHAAYVACGMALELNKPVMLSCTGATASRNYMPALTEAYYRKLPLLVVTSSQVGSRVGNLFAQVTDRSCLPADIANFSATIQPVRSIADNAKVSQTINTAILAVARRGGGPAHINLETEYVQTFNTTCLPSVETIKRIDATFDGSPELSGQSKIAVWIGSHKAFSERQRLALDAFVKSHNAVILHDHTSSYYGDVGVVSAIGTAQSGLHRIAELKPDLIVHIGEVSGDYFTTGYLNNRADVWRISPDGEVRNTFGRLRYVFEMPEEIFFEHYTLSRLSSATPLYCELWRNYIGQMRNRIGELPFSNTWIAQTTADRIPCGSTVHFAILNSLRSWNNFNLPAGVVSSGNVGGFGIDGCTSTLIGSSLIKKNNLCICVTGDLAFFYDINAIGNRHIGKNLRILLINNGCGGEFLRFEVVKDQLGDGICDYIAAEGHFGSKSKTFVKNLAEELGFKYLSASCKDEYLSHIGDFLNESDNPILLECFTMAECDVVAAKKVETLDTSLSMKSSMSQIIPTSLKKAIKTILDR